MPKTVRKNKYQYSVRAALSPETELLFKAISVKKKTTMTKLARQVIEEYCTQQLTESVPESAAVQESEMIAAPCE